MVRLLPVLIEFVDLMVLPGFIFLFVKSLLRSAEFMVGLSAYPRSLREKNTATPIMGRIGYPTTGWPAVVLHYFSRIQGSNSHKKIIHLQWRGAIGKVLILQNFLFVLYPRKNGRTKKSLSTRTQMVKLQYGFLRLIADGSGNLRKKGNGKPWNKDMAHFASSVVAIPGKIGRKEAEISKESGDKLLIPIRPILNAGDYSLSVTARLANL